MNRSGRGVIEAVATLIILPLVWADVVKLRDVEGFRLRVRIHEFTLGIIR